MMSKMLSGVRKTKRKKEREGKKEEAFNENNPVTFTIDLFKCLLQHLIIKQNLKDLT